MARVYKAFEVPQLAAAHAAATSTGTADKQTLTAPGWANAMKLSATTTNARCTFSGEDPVAGALGIVVVAGAQGDFYPCAADIEFVSEAAADSILNVLWLK